MSGSTARNYTPAQNLSDRAELLHTGVRMRANLGTFTAALGSTLQIKLRNVGVMTRIKARILGTGAIGTANLVASKFGPYGLVNKLTFLDYNSVQRIFCPGWMAYFLASVRHGRPWMPTGQGLVDTAQTQQDTTTGASKAINFDLECPLAYDPMNDLTGAILAQTVVGEQFLQLTFPASPIGSDPTSAYVADGNNGTYAPSLTVQVFQDYIQQATGALPFIDLNSVYEFGATFQTSDNIVNGGSKFIDWPNVRTVMGAYFAFINNGAVTVNGTDISAINLIANGNTNMREQDPLDNRADLRQMLGGDLPAGMYYQGSRRNPIQTQIYSQVQTQFTIGGAVTNPFFQYGFESTYRLMTPLPGMAQAA